MFTIYFDGEAETLINELGEKAIADELNREEKDLYRKIRKALQHLETNPRHPGLKAWKGSFRKIIKRMIALC